MNAEQRRLEAQRKEKENWRLWGPYLSERAWGTVREDYSPGGTAWEYFDHDQARSRAYRWNEDGMGGISDENQRLCFALSLWNSRDPILKERAFGLTGNEGNRGEDVKDYYFYLDASPTHSYLQYLYKYPMAQFPYEWLIHENRRRTRKDPPFSLLDTGAFDNGRYWDVFVVYGKDSPDTILIQITAHNRSSEAATLHLLPTLWFRNTWSWGENGQKPKLYAAEAPKGAAWAVWAEHPEMGVYHLYGANKAELLFTENETNFEQLWGVSNPTPYVKDAFHRRVIDRDEFAVNPDRVGTKFAAWHKIDVPPKSSTTIDMVLSSHSPKEHYKGWALISSKEPFKGFDKILETRKSEADEFYDDVLPNASKEDASIFRQALAGLIWCKQFFHYDVGRWLDGDTLPPPENRKWGRNSKWRHLKAADVILMPDSWEYPWFAAWDLAFHCVAMALIDLDFAKEQLELLLTHRYLHPNGQIPAYEWAFEDVNPPVHAWAALEIFRMEKAQRGKGDLEFLHKIFNKLILNYGWWLNRKDPDNRSVFEGGFLGLDNISVYDRSQPLPPGFSLKQADASGWMAMFALNLTVMAIELAQEDPAYEDIAIQIHKQFFAIANSVHGHTETGIALWDSSDNFYKDAVVCPYGVYQLGVFSWVGLVPVFGIEVVGPEKFEKMPRYAAFLESHAGGKYDGNVICACPHTVNGRGDHFFSMPLPGNLPPMMQRVLNSEEFLSPHGIRALSKLHAMQRDLGDVPGIGRTMITYEPGESESGLFGGNSNWRGPIWFPLNYVFVRALEKVHRYLTETFTVSVPSLSGKPMTFEQAADVISERLINIFRRNEQGLRPVFPKDSPFQNDPHWKDLILFHEYFHGEDGHGLGAAHQTGWTAVVANLIKRQYTKDLEA